MASLTTDNTDGPGVGPWHVLAGPGSAIRAERPLRTRTALLRFGLLALLVVALVGVTAAVEIRRLAERESLADVGQLTEVLARSVVQPALTDDMAGDPRAASAVLDRVLRPSRSDPLLVRVKVWSTVPGDDTTGVIIYSDEPRLIGRTFPLDEEAEEALDQHQVAADISDLSAPENFYERGQGTLLEAYRLLWTPGGDALLLEAYYRYDTVEQRSSGLWQGFLGILVATVLALLALLAPLVALLVRRTRRDQRQRQAIAQRALAASDEERRRIGASLHDGAVQQLAAASFDLAGRARRARTAGESTRADELDTMAGTLRGTVGALRSLLVEIYPPSVGAAGLAVALRDLGSTVVGGRAEVVFDLDDEAAARLAPNVAEEVFRVAQESLRNAVKHARASLVAVRLDRVRAPGSLGGDRVRLEIVDDGVGFDAAATIRSGRIGHLGLRLLVDAAHRCRGELAVASRLGAGSRLRLEVPI